MTTLALGPLPRPASPSQPLSDPRPTYGPHWFAMVMGTAMVSIALQGLPFHAPGQALIAAGFWVLSLALLAAVTLAGARRRRSRPGLFTAHLKDPAVGHFYGAPGIALMSVGTATLLAGPPLLGHHTAIAIDGALWSLGTVVGLATAVLVPVTAITHHRYDEATGHHPAAIGSWLLPLVCPLVSASTGALLAPHIAHDRLRETLVLGSYALAGVSVIACLVTFGHLWGELLRHGPGPAAAAPLLWIPLGFLGQSVTAFGHLGEAAASIGSTSIGPTSIQIAPAFRSFGVLYGLPVWGCAVGWLMIVLCLTAHARRRGLTFSLTWWSFTFPLGTVVTASSVLAQSTGLGVLAVVAGVLMAALILIWCAVAIGTVRLLVLAPRALLRRAG